MKIQAKSEKGMGERGWGIKREGEGLQKRGGAPHLACALGPTTWGSGPVIESLEKLRYASMIEYNLK